mgnify:CR=1 FL=1
MPFFNRDDVVTITAEEAKAAFDADPGAFIIYVREPGEFASGRIAGAVNVPLSELEQGALPARCLAGAGPVYIYCRSGRRSLAAALLLKRAGCARPINFGGILDWPYGVTKP